MKKVLIASILSLSIATAFAAPVDGAPQAECDGIKVATGPKAKGYSNLFKDIQKVCGSKVQLCEVNTSGGLDNLNLLSTKEADIGIAQLDTLNVMKGGDENIAALQVVAPLNFNYLHVVTSSTGFSTSQDKRFAGIKVGTDSKVNMINRFTELRGQRVAVVGSAQLLGRQLDKQLGYNMTFIDVKSDDEAFKLVQSGQVAAMMSVSGWPSGPVKSLTQAQNLTMIPFDAPANDPYKVRQLNYKNIATYNVNTLGVPNLLLTRQFSGERANKLKALQSCIQSNLSELKEGSYSPAWNEIKSLDETYGVAKFKAK